MIVLAVIAAVIIAAALIPIKICADYHGSFRLWVSVLFVRVNIFPRKKAAPPEENEPPAAPAGKTEDGTAAPFQDAGPQNEAAPQPERPKAPSEPKPKKQKDKEQKKKKPPEPLERKPEAKKAEDEAEKAEDNENFLDRFLRYYSIAAEFLDPFRRALRRLLKINELNVVVRAGTDDAAKTAVYSGALWGVAGNLLGLISRFVTIERQNIDIVPAFNETVFTAEGDCIIRTSLANIIGAAAIAAWAYLKFKLKNRRNKK